MNMTFGQTAAGKMEVPQLYDGRKTHIDKPGIHLWQIVASLLRRAHYLG